MYVYIFGGGVIYTEQIDTEGLSRKLLLTLFGEPPKSLKSRLWVLCDPSRHLQESPGPKWPEDSKKSLKKGLFGGSAEKSQKIPEKV